MNRCGRQNRINSSEAKWNKKNNFTVIHMRVVNEREAATLENKNIKKKYHLVRCFLLLFYCSVSPFTALHYIAITLNVNDSLFAVCFYLDIMCNVCSIVAMSSLRHLWGLFVVVANVAHWNLMCIIDVWNHSYTVIVHS